uniref:Uncharacterized protein n=1 Tax=Chelonoidis abingdonii TaxID=106734 RepID=A0A8C0QSL3_CHEAB
MFLLKVIHRVQGRPGLGCRFLSTAGLRSGPRTALTPRGWVSPWWGLSPFPAPGESLAARWPERKTLCCEWSPCAQGSEGLKPEFAPSPVLSIGPSPGLASTSWPTLPASISRCSGSALDALSSNAGALDEERS